jgi:hypothetical protein
MMMPKFLELKQTIRNHDILMMTETWLTAPKEQLYHIPEFDMYCSNRKDRIGGGVCIYTRKELRTKKLTEFTSTTMSSVWILLTLEKLSPIIYGVVYHPGGLTTALKQATVDHVVATVSSLTTKHKHAKLCLHGDFNDLDSSTITDALPLHQIVDFPTRGNNKLDLIFTDIDEYRHVGCTKEPPLANNDHCAISIPPTSIKALPYVSITKRKVSESSKIAVSRHLASIDWNTIISEIDIDSKVLHLHHTVKEIVDTYCPMVKVRAPQGKPVLDSPLIAKLRRAKRRAFSKGNPSWKYLAKLLSAKLKQLLKRHTDNLINKATKGSKRWWNQVKQLTGDTRSDTTQNRINIENTWQTIDQFVNNLNDYYLSGHSVIELDYPKCHPSTEPLTPITHIEVVQLLNNINTRKATHSNDFPSWVSKNNSEILAIPLTNIINTIMQTHTFPHLWKTAEIAPVKKVTRPTTYKDFRPISLLYHQSKVVESYINKLLRKELDGKLKNNQYAYTSGRSTTDALTHCITIIAQLLDNKENFAVQGLFLDFSKAFDLMRPDLLSKQLASLHVSPGLISLTKSFLSERVQTVRYNGTISKQLPSAIGVPQGTLTGPILWNAFVDSLQPSTHTIKYADDTSLFTPVKSTNISSKHKDGSTITFFTTENELQRHADDAVEWCDINHMKLNATKTKAMNLTLRSNAISQNPVIINNICIEQVTCTKLLGVHIDNHLSFTTHVSERIALSKRHVHALVMLKRSGIADDHLVLFYKARIMPTLSYAAPSWFPYTSNTDRDKLLRLERLCLRIIYPEVETSSGHYELAGMVDIKTLLSDLCSIYAQSVAADKNHPLHQLIPNRQSVSRRHSARVHDSLLKAARTSLYGKNIFYTYLN